MGCAQISTMPDCAVSFSRSLCLRVSSTCAPVGAQRPQLAGPDIPEVTSCWASASCVVGLFPTPGPLQESREAGFQRKTFLGMVPDKLPVPDFSCCPTGQVASPRIRKMPAGGLETVGRSALWYEPLCGYSCPWAGAQIDPGSVGARAPAVRSLLCSVTGRVMLCHLGHGVFSPHCSWATK